MDELDLDTIDYFRSDALLANPHPYFDQLRRLGPAVREPHHDVVLVTGYEEVVAIEDDAETFSACNSVSGPFPGMPVPLEGDDVSELIERHRDQLPMSTNLVTMDPPRHTAYRSLLLRLLTPKHLLDTTEFMQILADRLIDEFVDLGECELIRQFAGPFALLNICALLGVPETDHEMFLIEMLGSRRDRGLGNIRSQTPEDPFAFLHERFTAYIDDRRAQPRGDIMTTLATTPFPDGSMPDVMDIVRVASTLFAAGTGTTTHTLAAGLRFIAERPDLQDVLRKDPEQIPTFVEETLRLEGSVTGSFRLSRVPATIGKADYPAGSTVMIVFAAANRDPGRFDGPHELRLDRANVREHLAFGRGIHSCAGAALARTEIRIGVERLLSRLGGITIAPAFHGPPSARSYDFAPSYQLHGLQDLHLEFVTDNADQATRTR